MYQKICLTILLTLSWASLSIERHTIKEVDLEPEKAIYRHFVERPYSSDEFWSIPSKDHFFHFLNESKIDSKTISLIKRNIVEDFPNKNEAFRTFFRTRFLLDEGYVLLSIEDKKRISIEDVVKIYQYLDFINRRIVGDFKMKSVAPFLEVIDSLEISKKEKERAKSLIYEGVNPNVFYLPIVPELWEILPKNVREFVIYLNLNVLVPNKAVEYFIEINSFVDIEKISEDYSLGSRDQIIIKRYLTRKFRSNDYKTLRIDLKSILPPFLRKNIGSFSASSFSNCFNASFCFFMKNYYLKTFVDIDESKKILTENFIKVKDEKPRFGDIIVFIKDGNPEHMAVYINEKVYFTKNGNTKFSPFMLSTKEELFSKYSGSRISYYRIREERLSCVQSIWKFNNQRSLFQ